MDKRKAEIYISLFLIIISMVILVNDNLVEGGVESDLGSLFLPRVVAVILIALSLSMGMKAINEIKKEKRVNAENLINKEGFSGVFIYLAIIFFYWLSMPYIGFLISTIITMLLVAKLLNAQQWLKVIAMTLIVAVSINYGAKEFLHVYLPAGEWL